jgi:predicted Zn finger-like uncharacterized protein
MKFTCAQCQTRYAIPDENVAGRSLKIRCSRCQSVMAIKGPPQLLATGLYEPLQLKPTQSPPAPHGRVYWCGIGGEAHGPFSRAEVGRLVERGDITARSRMWRPGYAQWARVCESPDLTWVYAAVMQRTSEDQMLLGARGSSAVFDRAALVGDGRGYFPDPTLKSGWFILDEQTQTFLRQRLDENLKAAAPTTEIARPGPAPRARVAFVAALTALVMAVSTLIGMAIHMEGPSEIPAQLERSAPKAPPISQRGDGILAWVNLR